MPDAPRGAARARRAAAWLLLPPEPVEPPPALKARLLPAAAADGGRGASPSTGDRRRRSSPSTRRANSDTLQATSRNRSGNHWSFYRAREAAGTRRADRPELARHAAPAPPHLACARRPPCSWPSLGGYALTLRGELADQEAYRQAVEQALALAAESGSATAVIAGGEGLATGLGAIGADGTVELTVRGLAPTPGREVYRRGRSARRGTRVTR